MITLWLLDRSDGQPVADMMMLDGKWYTDERGFVYGCPVTALVTRAFRRDDLFVVLDWHGRRLPVDVTLTADPCQGDTITMLEVAVTHEQVRS